MQIIAVDTNCEKEEGTAALITDHQAKFSQGWTWRSQASQGFIEERGGRTGGVRGHKGRKIIRSGRGSGICAGLHSGAQEVKRHF